MGATDAIETCDLLATYTDGVFVGQGYGRGDLILILILILEGSINTARQNTASPCRK
jgi:hypothetical protein